MVPVEPDRHHSTPRGFTMDNTAMSPLSAAELDAEGVTALPSKEVISLLDLNADLDLALDVAAPIDLAIAANANVAAPIDAAVSANILSFGSESAALADQDAVIQQGISGDAIADSTQDSTLDQAAETAPVGTEPVATDGTSGTGVEAVPLPTDGVTEAVAPTADSLLGGNLLNIDVNAALDADLAAPVAGAVAANANVAAPIDAAVSANVLSVDSQSTAIADQDVVIVQDLDDVTAEATTDQTSDINQ